MFGPGQENGMPTTTGKRGSTGRAVGAIEPDETSVMDGCAVMGAVVMSGLDVRLEEPPGDELTLPDTDGPVLELTIAEVLEPASTVVVDV